MTPQELYAAVLCMRTLVNELGLKLNRQAQLAAVLDHLLRPDGDDGGPADFGAIAIAETIFEALSDDSLIRRLQQSLDELTTATTHP